MLCRGKFVIIACDPMKISVIYPGAAYRLIILALIALTPIFNLGELLALLKNALTVSDISLTPVFIKLIKDAGFAAIIFIGVLNFFFNGAVFRSRWFFYFILAVLFSVAVSFFSGTGISYVLFGARWILPLITLLFLYKYVDASFQKRIASLMFLLFIMAFMMQFWELFHLKNWFGPGFMGLSLRNPGFFITPTLMAVFALMTMYYVYHFQENILLRNLTVYLFGPLSVLLAASGTGLISLMLFYFVNIYSFNRYKALVLILSILVLVGGVLMLPTITSRRDIYSSFYTRLAIMVDSVQAESLVISRNFGMASNVASTAKRMAQEDGGHFVADSTLTSMAYNTGLFSVVLFFSFVLGLFLKRQVCFHFWAVYLPFMMTNILFESFPANLLFVVNMAYFYHLRTQSRKISLIVSEKK